MGGSVEGSVGGSVGGFCGKFCGRFCGSFCGRFCGTVLRFLLRRAVEGISGQAWTGRTNQHNPSIALMSVGGRFCGRVQIRFGRIF